MFLFIHGLDFSDISFLQSLRFGTFSSNSVFILAKSKSKTKLVQISYEDKILSEGTSFKSFLNSSRLKNL